MPSNQLESSPSLVSACRGLTGTVNQHAALYVLVLFFMKCATRRERETHFLIPNGCGFDDIVAIKEMQDVGERIAAVIGAVADANPSIKGVVDVANWGDSGLLGENEERRRRLSKLVDSIDSIELDEEAGQLEELLAALSSNDGTQRSPAPSTVHECLVSHQLPVPPDVGSIGLLNFSQAVDTFDPVPALVRCTVRLFANSDFDTDAPSIFKARTSSEKRHSSAAPTASVTVDELRTAALALLDLAAEQEERAGTLPLKSLGVRLPIANGTADDDVTIMTGLESRGFQDVDSVKTMASLAPLIRRVLEVSGARDEQRARDRALVHGARVEGVIEREVEARGGWGGDLKEMATWQSMKGAIASELSVIASELQGRPVSVEETAAILARVSISPRAKGGLPGLARTVVVSLTGQSTGEGIAVLKDASESLPAMRPFPRNAAEHNKRLRQLRYALHCMQFDEPKRTRMDAVLHTFLVADVEDLDPAVDGKGELQLVGDSPADDAFRGQH